MSDPVEPQEPRAIPARHSPYDHADPSSSGVMVPLLIAPVIVTVFLAGGVYWLRMLPPAGAGAHEQSSTVMVRLIPRADPAPIPTPAVPPATTPNVAALAPVARDEQDQEPVVAKAPANVPQPQNVPPSAAESAATGAAPPNRVAIQFQQALFRHIGRYQRYPSDARRNHLEGTVETLFSMTRDGTLLNVWIKRSSGQPVLDREAIETVRRAQPLPPIPPELPARLNVQLLLAFDPS